MAELIRIPRLQDLVTELKGVDWYELGIHLGIPLHRLRQIEQDYTAEDRRRFEMLHCWLNIALEVSWKEIVEALRRIGRYKDIVYMIELKYITPDIIIPSIIAHPEDQMLECYGGKVILSIKASTVDGQLTYEWFKDEMIITSKILPYCRKYSTPNLEISPFMPEYEGKYKCTVRNKFGVVDSKEAKISVKPMEKKGILCCGEVDSNGGILKGAGIEIQIPKCALAPGECTTLAVYASTESPIYSEQSKVLIVSPIFDVECVPDIQFKKEIVLAIEHFAKLETKSDLNDLVFLVSKTGEEFQQSGQVESQIGSTQGKVSVLHFCRFAFGKKKNPNYKYSMLVALPKNCCLLDRPVWAFFSISVDSKTYKKLFETYLKKKFDDHPFYPIDSTPIDSIGAEISLTIPDHTHTGEYRIQSDIHPPKVLKRRVIAASKEVAVYPPRIRLDIGLSKPPRSSLMCHVPIQGIDNVESFALRATCDCEGVSTQGRYEPHDQCNTSHHALLLTQLSENAAKWRDIATHLGFRQGELNTIESKPSLLHGAPNSWLNAMLAEWLEWAPRDRRGSNEVATLSSLKYAVRMAGLGRTASELTINVV